MKLLRKGFSCSTQDWDSAIASRRREGSWHEQHRSQWAREGRHHGGRKQFKRKLNQWGKYLEHGEWAGTFRAWNVEHDDDSKDAAGTGFDGIIEFKQLANGNLTARIEWNHAVDDTPQSADYIISLSPYNRTFTGLGYLAGFDETARATGYFDPKRGLLNVIDIGPSQGSLTGGTFIRTWDFVDIG